MGKIFSGLGLISTSSTRLVLPPAIPAPPTSSSLRITASFTPAAAKKLAEHGGFAHDDTNVIMLLSNPSFTSRAIYSSVDTAQVAPTILKVLGLNPNLLQGVQMEGTQALPLF